MNIVVASAYEIFSKGITSAIQEEFSQYHIERLHPAEETQPSGKSLLILDIDSHQHTYTDKINRWKTATDQASVLLLSSDIENHMLDQILELEVEGFLLKDVGANELHRAIFQIISGERYYDQRIIQHIINRKYSTHANNEDALIDITPKQKQILKLIAEEYTNKEIGEQLGISTRTVDGHRYRLIKRFRVKNTAGLIRYAFKEGLLAET